MAEACKRLIKNCIICWNYLYLSQKLAQIDDPADPVRGEGLSGTRAEICRTARPPEEPVRERVRGVAGVNCGPWKHRLCVHAIARSFVATISHGSVVQSPPVSSSVLNK
ncbi:MAG: hypothetical protein QOF56_3543 [Acidobacteriaceae bacterium]|nr:hypothetical protein [Acidobacteriaceae bacterium]